jgi:RND family efflux transporter MFP subunit
MRSLLNRVLLIIPTFLAATFVLSANAEVTQVDVYYPELSPSHEVLQLTGTVEAVQNSELASFQSGLIAAIYVEAGDTVAKGEKLLSLDDTLVRLNLAEAVASMEAAEVKLQESERLYNEVSTLSKQKVVADTIIGERRSNLASAKAELTMQQANLARQKEIVNRHTLYAPFSGVIANRNADVGEWVSQQTKVFNLIEQQNLRLKVAIPQEYYALLVDQKNIMTTVTPDFSNATTIEATLDRLIAISNNLNRTFTALINLPESAPLVAGMSASVEIKLPTTSQGVIWLPKSAIKQHPDGGVSIFAVVDNKAKRFIVKVLKQQNNLVAISSAPANLAFVISGVELLREGDELEIRAGKGQSK